MSLPAELKNQIYALALTDERSIFLASRLKRYRRTVQRSIPSKFDLKSQYRRPMDSPGLRSFLRSSYASQQSDNSEELTLPTLVPNVLLLNKAIYAETQPILYAANTFAVEDTMAMHTFLAIIGPKNRATITDLTIRGWGYTRVHKALNNPAFAMLASAVSLTRLNLNCHMWGGTKRVAMQLYRDGFHWFEAVGVSKGKSDAALDMIEISERYLHTYGYYARVSDADEEAQLEKINAEIKAELRKLLS